MIAEIFETIRPADRKTLKESLKSMDEVVTRTGRLTRKAILLECLPKVPTSSGLKERAEKKNTRNELSKSKVALLELWKIFMKSSGKMVLKITKQWAHHNARINDIVSLTTVLNSSLRRYPKKKAALSSKNNV